jgi:glycine cleavage system H protein
VGDDITAGAELGTIESVKTADAVICPVSGCITEVNEAINDNPEIINESPEDKGWIAKLEIYDPLQLKDLMSKEEYDAWCKEDYADHF